MQAIANFQEAQQALRAFYGKHATGPYTLERMRQLLAYLDNPQDKLRIIHVAGTSGKTSTAYFVASLLQASGAKVGLTVSPHVDQLNERVQIRLIPLPEQAFCISLTEFLGLVKESGILPSYFECMVAFAYWTFVRERVEYAVIEVGLGGLLDGTNVVEREDKICIITDIGLDHTELLGDTIGEIAIQKAGIIQTYNEVWMYPQGAAVMQAVQQRCKDKAAHLNLVDEKPATAAAKLPLFQIRNYGLARATVEQLLERDNRSGLTETQEQTAAAVYIPARMEIISHGKKVIIVDGAHNAQKLETLFKSIADKYPGHSIAALVGFVEGDTTRLTGGLDVLMSHAHFMVITAFYSEKDYQKYSVPPQDIVRYCHEKGWDNLHIEAEPRDALHNVLARPETIIVITGSFYLLNHIRPLLFNEEFV